MSGRQIERRRAPRVQAGFAIEVHERGEPHEARLEDLSTNGLCFTMSRAITEMTLLELRLDLPGAGPCRLRGAVVRCAKLRGVTPPTYQVAVYITEMDAESRLRLRGFVQRATANA